MSVAALTTPTPLRVLQVNSMLTGGGTDDQCLNLTHGLVQLGQQVLLAGPDGRHYSAVARKLGLDFCPTPDEGPLKLRFIFRVAQLIRRRKPELVHAHHGRDLWPTILAVRLSRRRPLLIMTRHLAKSPSSWLSRRFLLQNCDGLIAVSQFVATVLREGVYEPDAVEAERRSRAPIQGDHSKIKVIYPGIDTEHFRPADATGMRQNWGVKHTDFVFAVVGGYDFPRGKGQREFLKAAAAIHKRIPNARFLIVGRGTLKETLENDITQLGLRGKAWLTPYCTDMPAAMNALDCLVHPQVGTEAFGAVLLEAFACGKPVLASALDGIPESFAAGGHGRLLPPEDIPALAEAMCDWATRLPSSEGEKEALHLKISREFSHKANACNVLSYYQGLIERHRPKPAGVLGMSGLRTPKG